MTTFTCPSCAAPMSAASPGSTVCAKCGKPVVVAMGQTLKEPPQPELFALGWLVGVLLFIAGLFGVLYYWKLMDTTLPLDPVIVAKRDHPQERVHNIGLMDERRNGLLVSMGAVAFGFVLASRKS